MRRRGWFLFQVVGLIVLFVGAPGAVHGLVEGFAGPYEVHAAPPVEATDAPETLADDRGAAPTADEEQSASTP